MKYRWNIAHNAKHYCAIYKDTYQPEDRKDFKEQLERSFPPSQGYSISVSIERTTRKSIDLNAEAEMIAGWEA